jgi:hypothetical protein
LNKPLSIPVWRELLARTRRPGLLACLLAFTLTACNQQPASHEFRLNKVSVTPIYQGISAAFDQKLQLSPDAQDALEHGVALTIRIDMELREGGSLVEHAADSRRYVIDYLPLSRRYQLSGPQDTEKQTFPRLRHVLHQLDNVNLVLATGPLPAGTYELRVRVKMDHTRLPAPMRLPAWFSAQWQHDSEWSIWPFDIGV